MAATLPIWMADAAAAASMGGVAADATIDIDALVVELFRREASSLVRLTNSRSSSETKLNCTEKSSRHPV